MASNRSKRYRDNLNSDYFCVLPLNDDNESSSSQSSSEDDSSSSCGSTNSSIKSTFDFQYDEQLEFEDDVDFNSLNNDTENILEQAIYNNATINYEQFVYSFLCLLDKLKISKVTKYFLIKWLI